MKLESMDGRRDGLATMSVEAAGVGGSVGRGMIAAMVDCNCDVVVIVLECRC